MARVLLTWELGGALGHLMSLRPLAKSLSARGHKIFLAARDLSQVRRVFADIDLTLLQSPWNSRRFQIIQPVITYADMLLNVGFAEIEAVAGHVDAWRAMFELVQPDLLVCDHSPTALLAAKGSDFGVATAGTGFFCPVDESPLRHVRNLAPELRPKALQHEQKLLDMLNELLKRRSLPSLQRVTQLYHDEKTRHFLLTFAELDHFPGRGGAKYWGTWPFGMSGEPFVRPGTGPCIFAYLKPFEALTRVLADLTNAPFRTVAYVDALRESDRARFESEKLRLPKNPVNVSQAAANCDLALTNATHGTCIAMLLKGKPLVHVPHFLEQELFAATTERLGASVRARADEQGGTRRAVERVLSDRRYAAAAAGFAQRYKNHRFDQAADAIVDEMEQMIPSRG
jgi:hypothetical protein